MATSADQYSRWNRALVSVYHYGRSRKNKPLHGRPVPLTIMPLHHAVTVLIEPLDKEALHAVRLALSDLCRTRAGLGPDANVDREIERLGTAFSRLTSQAKGPDHHAMVAQRFADIFLDGEKSKKKHAKRTIGEEDAYLAALQYMKAAPTKRADLSALPSSWKVGSKALRK